MRGRAPGIVSAKSSRAEKLLDTEIPGGMGKKGRTSKSRFLSAIQIYDRKPPVREVTVVLR